MEKPFDVSRRQGREALPRLQAALTSSKKTCSVVTQTEELESAARYASECLSALFTRETPETLFRFKVSISYDWNAPGDYQVEMSDTSVELILNRIPDRLITTHEVIKPLVVLHLAAHAYVDVVLQDNPDHDFRVKSPATSLYLDAISTTHNERAIVRRRLWN